MSTVTIKPTATQLKIIADVSRARDVAESQFNLALTAIISGHYEQGKLVEIKNDGTIVLEVPDAPELKLEAPAEG